MQGAREVLELRIHGVGGAAPEELLGVASSSETIRVAGDELAGFHARRADRHVEGYVWGRLNSAAWEQPAWILLLPFTLVNVAGWFVPAAQSARRHVERAGDIVLFVFALGMTALYALWLADIAIEQVAIAWVYEHLRHLSELLERRETVSVADYRVGYLVALAIGSGIAVAALALTRRLARTSQARYERAAEADSSTSSVTGARIRQGQPALEDETFWSRASDARRLLAWHGSVATISVAIVVIWCLVRFLTAVAAPVPLRLYLMFKGLLLAQVVLLFLLAILRWIAWAAAPSRLTHAVGGPVLCALALALANALMYGVGNLIYERVHSGRSPVQLGVPVGAVALVAVVVVVIVLRRVTHMSPEEAGAIDVAPEQAALGHEVRVESRGVLRSAVRQEHIAAFLPRAGWTLLALAVTFVVALIYRVVSPDGWRDVLAERLAARFGAWLLWVAATALLVFVIRSFRQSAGRRPVAIMWDVLSFWPRRFHPFAVRPYAERAVPEIEARLQRHFLEHRSVLVSAHSQGSVLAYATFVRMATTTPDSLERLAFVTYGTPLKNLYARFFPRYFSVDRFVELRGRLAMIATQGDGWRNFYRSTDYVGTTVFPDSDATAYEMWLPDPPREPLVDDLPLAEPVPAGNDTPPPAYTKLAVHSHYTSELGIRHYIDDVAIPALARTPS